jgi:membrane-bound lytic murein transglycosylase A
MIAQDTGSAINGPARADLYWGAGDTAGRIAGRIRQQGQFVMLLPRELDLVEAGKHMPLPPSKPAIALAKNDTGKVDAQARGAEEPVLRKSHRPPEPMSRRQARLKSKTGT